MPQKEAKFHREFNSVDGDVGGSDGAEWRNSEIERKNVATTDIFTRGEEKLFVK